MLRAAPVPSCQNRAAPEPIAEGDGPTVFAHACKMGLEGHRVEAQGLRLSFRPFAGLVEDEESERSSGEARGRRRIGAAKGGDDTIALFSRRAMKVTNDGSSDSFVIPCLSTALGWVERYCLLELLRRRRWLGLDDFRTDLYVIGHFGLAFVAYVLPFWVSFTYEVNLTLGALVILYSAWRIIELVAFFLMQIIGGRPTVASPERSFVLALFNYFEVTFWFAVWYSVLVTCGSLKVASPSGLSIFRESLAMMLVNSTNAFDQTSSWFVWTAMCVQSVVGLFLTLVVVARTVASLPPLKKLGT